MLLLMLLLMLLSGGQSKGIQFVAPQGCSQRSKQQQQQQQGREDIIRSQLQSLSCPSVVQRYISPPLLLSHK
jgi:UPF0716 family protein affecting phage T7 exclusion